jgi:CRISPR/Cas system-associated exonuclease Cas4 (RecB family)
MKKLGIIVSCYDKVDDTLAQLDILSFDPYKRPIIVSYMGYEEPPKEFLDYHFVQFPSPGFTSGPLMSLVHSLRKAPELPSDYARKLSGHLRAVQTLTEKVGFDGELEHKFHYDLDPPNGRYITGFIDRFIQKNDKAFIIDYKTTKKGPYRKNKGNIMHDLQLRAYAKVIQKTFNIKAENIKAALYYLEGGDLIATSFNQESIDSAEKELLRAYIDIQNADADKVWGKVGNHCTRCDYNDICPFYNIKI